VFWVDERVVPKDHADSNYRLASDQFLSKVSTCSVKFINMFDCETAGLFLLI
jgi:6-phosphogluconolactonase/glucosamine-6-phosphate isomerase/deaminase